MVGVTVLTWSRKRNLYSSSTEPSSYMGLGSVIRLQSKARDKILNIKVLPSIQEVLGTMKSAYWPVPVLLSSVVFESAVVSTPLRNSLFLRCQDCGQLISTRCDVRCLFPEIVDPHNQHAYPVGPCPLYYDGSEWNEMLTESLTSCTEHAIGHNWSDDQLIQGLSFCLGG